jgi:hypothetical protein
MEKVGIFYGRLEYITAIWYILWPFGNLVAIWDSFPRFGILCQEQSGNPVSLQVLFPHDSVRISVANIFILSEKNNSIKIVNVSKTNLFVKILRLNN